MRCKAGDLAYIVGSPNTTKESVGMVVEVISFERCDVKFGAVWNVRSSKPIQTWQSDTNESLGLKTDFHCPDDWMRPIGGVPVTDDVSDEVPA